MNEFIKLSVIYPSNPTKQNRTENDMAMREIYIRPGDIMEISTVVPDDGAVLAKSYITMSYLGPGRSLSVAESVEEIFALMSKVTA